MLIYEGIFRIYNYNKEVEIIINSYETKTCSDDDGNYKKYNEYFKQTGNHNYNKTADECIEFRGNWPRKLNKFGILEKSELNKLRPSYFDEDDLYSYYILSDNLDYIKEQFNEIKENTIKDIDKHLNELQTNKDNLNKLNIFDYQVIEK